MHNMLLRTVLFTYCCVIGKHPAHSGIKQQPFLCAHGFSGSIILTAQRGRFPSAPWCLALQLRWLKQLGLESPSGFFLLAPERGWLKGWLQLELLTRASTLSLLCGLGFSYLGSKRECYSGEQLESEHSKRTRWTLLGFYWPGLGSHFCCIRLIISESRRPPRLWDYCWGHLWKMQSATKTTKWELGDNEGFNQELGGEKERKSKIWITAWN